MKVKSATLPLSRTDINIRLNEHNTTIAEVILWNGNYIESLNDEGTTEYEYDLFITKTRNRNNLVQSIENNFEVWYNKAKADEIAELIKKPPLTIDKLAEDVNAALIAVMELSLE